TGGLSVRVKSKAVPIQPITFRLAVFVPRFLAITVVLFHNRHKWTDHIAVVPLQRFAPQVFRSRPRFHLDGAGAGAAVFSLPFLAYKRICSIRCYPAFCQDGRQGAPIRTSPLFW